MCILFISSVAVAVHNLPYHSELRLSGTRLCRIQRRESGTNGFLWFLKGAYPRVIRYHHEIQPQPQSSLTRGHFPQKPGFRKMAVGQRWPMNNLISFWQFVPMFWVLWMTVQKSCFLLIKMAIFQHY